MLQRRGLHRDAAYPLLGISRATLYNWLKRHDPPPSKKHRQKLVEFFGEPEDFVLRGMVTSVQGSKTFPLQRREEIPIEEPPASYHSAVPDEMIARARAKLEALLSVAEGNPERLSWLLIELDQLQFYTSAWMNTRERSHRVLKRKSIEDAENAGGSGQVAGVVPLHAPRTLTGVVSALDPVRDAKQIQR